MKNNDFHKGITLTALGSFWWGVIGVIYFEYISFIFYNFKKNIPFRKIKGGYY